MGEAIAEVGEHGGIGVRKLGRRLLENRTPQRLGGGHRARAVGRSGQPHQLGPGRGLDQGRQRLVGTDSPQDGGAERRAILRQRIDRHFRRRGQRRRLQQGHQPPPGHLVGARRDGVHDGVRHRTRPARSAPFVHGRRSSQRPGTPRGSGAREWSL